MFELQLPFCSSHFDLFPVNEFRNGVRDYVLYHVVGFGVVFAVGFLVPAEFRAVCYAPDYVQYQVLVFEVPYELARMAWYLAVLAL